MSYKIHYMEGFRSLNNQSGGGIGYMLRNAPQGMYSYVNANGGTDMVTTFSFDGVAYKGIALRQGGNWGNGRCVIYNIFRNIAFGKNVRTYMGVRILVPSMPINSRYWRFNLGNAPTGGSTVFFAPPALSGTWYLEFVLDPVAKKVYLYRNGVLYSSLPYVKDNTTYLSDFFFGSDTDDGSIYGRTLGATDIYFATEEVETGEEPHRIYGPLVIEDVQVEDFDGQTWQPSNADKTPVQIFNQSWPTGNWKGEYVNSPFDGKVGTITFKDVDYDNIIAAMVQIRANRGLSSTGKLHIQASNPRGDVKTPPVISVPPNTAADFMGSYYIVMEKDFQGNDWSKSSLKDIRFNMKSIPEMSTSTE